MKLFLMLFVFIGSLSAFSAESDVSCFNSNNEVVAELNLDSIDDLFVEGEVVLEESYDKGCVTLVVGSLSCRTQGLPGRKRCTRKRCDGKLVTKCGSCMPL